MALLYRDPLADMYGVQDEPASMLTPQGTVVPMRARKNAFSDLPAPPRSNSATIAGRNAALAQKQAEEEAAATRAAAEAARRAKVDAAKAAIPSDPEQAIFAPQSDESANLARGRQRSGRETFNNAARALSGRTASTSPRPGYAQTKQYTDTMVGHDAEYVRDARGKIVKGPDGKPMIRPAETGLVQEQDPLAQNVHAAELERERIAADTYESLADRQLQAMTQLRANQQAQADRQQAQIDRTRYVNDLALKGADEFQKMADVDPGRYWKSQPAFMKFIAAIAAGLKGWAGRTDATSHITDAIQMDIQAQQAAIAKASSHVGNLQAQAAREESVYGQILAQTNSVQEANLVYTKALLEHAGAETAARLQRANIPLTDARAQLAMNGLRQQIASVEQQLGRVAAGNTPTITTVRPTVGDKDARRLLVKLGESGISEMEAGRSDRAKTAAASAEQAGKLEIARAKGPSVQQQRLDAEERSLIVKESKDAVNLKNAIQSFRSRHSGKDITGLTYGVGRHEVPFTDADEDAQFDLGLIEDQLTTWMTGASSPPEMQERYLSSIRNAKSEGELWNALDRIEERADADIERVRRGVSKGSRAQYERVDPDVLPDYGPDVANTGAPDSEVWEE